MVLTSKVHTAGDTKQWTVQYGQWLTNPAQIQSINITTNSTTCTIKPTPTILGTDVVFFLVGGVVGEQVTVMLIMTDDRGNVKNDTIKFTVVAP